RPRRREPDRAAPPAPPAPRPRWRAEAGGWPCRAPPCSGGLGDQRRVEIADHRLDDRRVFGAIDRRAEFRRARQPLRIPADMLARDAAADGRAIVEEHVLVMAEQGVALTVERRVRQALAGLEEMDHLADEPGPAIGAAPDHQPV